MTSQEILQKALTKAEENGYRIKFSQRYNLDGYMHLRKFYAVIFNHEFAKALWGERQVDTGYVEIHGLSGEGYADTSCITTESWKFHLQQMVLEENPLEYLRKFS